MVRQVFEIKNINVVYEAASVAGTLKVLTDLPGRTMAQRGADIPLPLTTTRTPMTKELAIEGMMISSTWIAGAGTGKLKVYEAWCDVKAIGLYLDGSQGETYTTPEATIGV